MDLDDFYQPQESDDEDLEVAANVVFGRLRRSTDYSDQGYDLAGNKVSSRRMKHRLETNRVRRQADTTDLKYKQFVPEDEIEDDPAAKTIDFGTIAQANRPADVLEYKRFLKVIS